MKIRLHCEPLSFLNRRRQKQPHDEDANDADDETVLNKWRARTRGKSENGELKARIFRRVSHTDISRFL